MRGNNHMHPFFSYDNLVSLVEPLEPGFPYYRPFILHGEPEQVDLFLIGINPASSVFPKNGVTMDYWIETIMKQNFYNERFSSNGKTRIGINGILSYIKSQYPFSIIETNINAFPTAKSYDLKRRKFLLSAIEGNNIFNKVLAAHEPSIIILFGKEAVDYFIDFLLISQFIKYDPSLEDISIVDCEHLFPFITFFYPSGKEARVFACRHLRYFGHKGKTFNKFVSGLTPFLIELKNVKNNC
jgi:hypothetical protein